MEFFRVSFIGHRGIDDYREIETQLNKILPNLLFTKEFVEFQIGRNGDFDLFVASCIKRIQKQYDMGNSAMTLVLPYPVADMEYYENYYDSVIIPEEASISHPKSAITKRNQWLCDNADLLIAYVHRDKGGAATCLKYAEKVGIKIVRI